ncbi:MAG: MerC domain-containing protein [Armatimonadota bacterium]
MNERTGRRGFWSRHLDKIGVTGSLIAALCCLGVPAVIAVASALGLGFLINDATLLPLLLIFLLVLLSGLWLGVRHHRNPLALVVGLVSAVVTVVFLFVRFSRPLAYVGIAGLLVSSIINILIRQRQLRA